MGERRVGEERVAVHALEGLKMAEVAIVGHDVYSRAWLDASLAENRRNVRRGRRLVHLNWTVLVVEMQTTLAKVTVQLMDGA